MLEVSRRALLSGAGAAALVVVGASRGRADAYPTRIVTIVNPFAAGSISDAAARLVADSLDKQFGQRFIVENKVGAGGAIAGVTVSRAAPDGHTLLLAASSSFSGLALYKQPPFDPLADFTHIARIGSFPSFIAVNRDLPVRTIAEFVDHARKNPGKLSYGHGNNVGQIAGETLKRRTGIDIVRVAYRSNPGAVTDLIAGHIQMMVPDLNTGLAHVRAGTIRPLAVFTKTRSPTLPDVPTLDESVMPGFDLLPWCGLSGPPGLPADVVRSLETAVQNALQSTEIREKFSSAGVEVFPGASAEYHAYVRDQLRSWTDLIKEAGIQAE